MVALLTGKKSKHFTESFVETGNGKISRCFTILMEDTKMYIPINPEYIIAYFEKPINLTRLIRIFRFLRLLFGKPAF